MDKALCYVIENAMNDNCEWIVPHCNLDSSNFLFGSHSSVKSCVMECINETVCSYFNHKHTPFHSGVWVMIFSKVNYKI